MATKKSKSKNRKTQLAKVKDLSGKKTKDVKGGFIVCRKGPDFIMCRKGN